MPSLAANGVVQGGCQYMFDLVHQDRIMVTGKAVTAAAVWQSQAEVTHKLSRIGHAGLKCPGISDNFNAQLETVHPCHHDAARVWALSSLGFSCKVMR